MIRVFIAIGLVVLFLIVGLPACGILFLLKRKDPVGAAEKAQALAAGVLKGITGLIGIRYETRGLENVPKEGGLLFASNHRSYYDIVAAYCTVNRQVGFIAKNGLWKALSLRRWMQLVNCYFLNREDIRQGLEVIKSATERVKNGGCVWVCPEGTRARTTPRFWNSMRRALRSRSGAVSRSCRWRSTAPGSAGSASSRRCCPVRSP